MTQTEYRTIRKQLGLTQAGLALLLGETRETISRRENSASIARRDKYALLWIAHQTTQKVTSNGASETRRHENPKTL